MKLLELWKAGRISRPMVERSLSLVLRVREEVFDRRATWLSVERRHKQELSELAGIALPGIRKEIIKLEAELSELDLKISALKEALS